MRQKEKLAIKENQHDINEQSPMVSHRIKTCDSAPSQSNSPYTFEKPLLS